MAITLSRRGPEAPVRLLTTFATGRPARRLAFGFAVLLHYPFACKASEIRVT